MSRYSLLALAAIFAAVSVNGVLDNSNVAQSLISAATSLPTGDYVITNVQSGQSLTFSRSDVTNFFPQDGSQSVNLEANGDGHIISGLGKCASAQWGFDAGNFDHAAVSYVCSVGSQGSSASTAVRDAKQIWLFVPVAGTTVPSAANDSSNNNHAADPSIAQTDAAVANNNNASTDGIPCRHPGWWLARHLEYVGTGGHTECSNQLSHYQATSRLARRSRQLQQRDVPVYNIIATDHILDQTTRAFSSQALDTFGGYRSTTLAEHDVNDPAQQWTVTKA